MGAYMRVWRHRMAMVTPSPVMLREPPPSDKMHTMCIRCGHYSFHLQKSTCSSCGYPSAHIRKFSELKVSPSAPFFAWHKHAKKPIRMVDTISVTVKDDGLKLIQVIIGPATVEGVQAGALKIGDTAGTIDNIIQCKLYRPGSVGFVSKSVAACLGGDKQGLEIRNQGDKDGERERSIARSKMLG
ncbi:hypothetical protein ZWY2020_008719 [Hordeum vulgare]|nr:hypothetical protein ZWY2020_008719 [Hordeum vulgare]